MKNQFKLGLGMLALVAVACSPTTEAPKDGTSTNNTTGTTPAPTEGGTLTAQGSSFVQPFFSKVFDEYKNKSGFHINYTGGGSGNGINSVIDGAIFGASDAPMNDEELANAKSKSNNDILNLPIVLGTLAVAYNLEGVESGLQLDAKTLSAIFRGKITKWNDPAITALNAGKTLPDMPIMVQVRADGSGSTYALSDFLSKADPDWQKEMGTNKKLKWGSHVSEWPKSDGVATNTKQTPGSISYMELAWAKKTGLGYAAIQNAAGKFVTPEPAGATAAAASAELPADFRVSIANAGGEASYPISSFVFALIPKDLTKSDQGKQLVDALRFVIGDGQGFASGLDYAPLPESVVTKVKAALDAITTK